MKIKTIEKGWGEDSTYFTTNKNGNSTAPLDEIKQEQRPYIIGEHDNMCADIVVYRGYRNGQMVFEIEAGSGITLTFWEE